MPAEFAHEYPIEVKEIIKPPPSIRSFRNTTDGHSNYFLHHSTPVDPSSTDSQKIYRNPLTDRRSFIARPRAYGMSSLLPNGSNEEGRLRDNLRPERTSDFENYYDILRRQRTNFDYSNNNDFSFGRENDNVNDDDLDEEDEEEEENGSDLFPAGFRLLESLGRTENPYSDLFYTGYSSTNNASRTDLVGRLTRTEDKKRELESKSEEPESKRRRQELMNRLFINRMKQNQLESVLRNVNATDEKDENEKEEEGNDDESIEDDDEEDDSDKEEDNHIPFLSFSEDNATLDDQFDEIESDIGEDDEEDEIQVKDKHDSPSLQDNLNREESIENILSLDPLSRNLMRSTPLTTSSSYVPSELPSLRNSGPLYSRSKSKLDRSSETSNETVIKSPDAKCETPNESCKESNEVATSKLWINPKFLLIGSKRKSNEEEDSNEVKMSDALQKVTMGNDDERKLKKMKSGVGLRHHSIL